MMKRISSFLVLLCALVMASACALAAQYNYQPMNSDRIVYSLPEGLSARVTKADGQLNVRVDSAATNWTQLVAYVNSASEIPMYLSSQAPSSDFTHYHQINLRNTISPQGGTILEQACIEFDTVINSEFVHKRPTDLNAYSQHRNEWDLAGFDAESSSVLPMPTDSFYVAYLIVWYGENVSPVYEYYFVNISFTDDSARKVALPNVPASRIQAYSDINMTTSVESGSIVYEIPLGHALCNQHIRTQVAAPSGARSWMLAGDDRIHPLISFELGGKQVQGMSIDYYVRTSAFAELETMTLLWYADEQGKNALKVERLAVDIIVGNPAPFPRYIDELSAVPANRVRSMFWTGEELTASVAGISNTYAANQADHDILRLTVDPQIIPANIHLEDVMAEAFIQVPSNAIAYSKHQRSRDTIHGNMPDYYERFVQALNEPSSREKIADSFDLETFDGKQYIYIGGTAACESKPFEHDPELLLYTESENSNRFAGRVTVIYWYDSLDADAAPIMKEYVVRKTDPFTLETKMPAYTDESQIPDRLELPVIIISKGEEITDLYLVIEKMPTSDPDHIYYDLYVVDADGNEHKLGGDAIVIIPYPDPQLGENAPYSFKLAHYHNGKKLEYTEENGLLWRTEHGLAFKTKDFSPFILSWEETDSAGAQDAAKQMPQTGDSAAPIALLAVLLGASLTGLLLLRRRSA